MKADAVSETGSRIQSVDLLRGAVMILMAIDHVRVFSGIPAGGPEIGVFFTRWVTHFCAPAFAFFAGTSAFLYGQKLNDRGKLSRYLVTRGIMLAVLELTLIRFFWVFHFNWFEFVLAGVIWMLGICMILMAPIIRLSPKTAGILGLAIIAGQPLFGLVPGLLPEPIQIPFTRIWEFVYPSGFDTFENVSVLYSIVPWIGVMAAGYGFGLILKMETEKKRKVCLTIGLSAIALYLVAGSALIFADPDSSGEIPFIFELLAQQKYPASVLFLLMTLGPVIALVPWADKVKGWFSDVLVVIGRVPFFYYLLHILLIHISALVVWTILDGSTHSAWFTYAPYVYIEPEFRWGLPLLYLVFAIDVTLLFFICRWYASYKISHPEKKWLKFL